MAHCRSCTSQQLSGFLDLGTAPPSNAYLSANDLRSPERWYPLRVSVCRDCWLAQTDDFVDREHLFSPDYAYFSSYSRSWLQHAQYYVASITHRLQLTERDWVVEIAANDGYLLQYFKQRNIPCTGIEPTHCTAVAAQQKGIEIIESFFGVQLANELKSTRGGAMLMVANNVLAHVPDLNDFVAGFAILLADHGVATFEFPHLLTLLEGKQFDTVYHEHFSYLSLTSLTPLFARHGLQVFDVETLATHGGSLRLYVKKKANVDQRILPSVEQCLANERDAGLMTLERFQRLQHECEKIRDDLQLFLIEARRKNWRVAAYGAAAKGNTLLNYSGIRADAIAWVADANPAKQNKYLPGSRIPIVDEARLRAEKPDVVLILPWNLSAEIAQQLHYVKSWGGQLWVAIPELRAL